MRFNIFSACMSWKCCCRRVSVQEFYGNSDCRKKENELYRIEQDNRSLEQYKEALKARERALNDRLQEAIRKTQEEDRVYMAQMVNFLCASICRCNN